MEIKKHLHVDLSKKRHTFLLTGFLFATALTLASFEFSSSFEPIEPTYDLPIEIVAIEYTPISVIPEKKQEKLELPKVMKKSPIIEIVPDDKVIPENLTTDDLPPVENIPDAKPIEVAVPATVTWAETMPMFMTGEEDLFAYLGDNINYPVKAFEANITGTVYVSFVVNEFGAVTNVELLKGIGGGCDEEALRVVKGLPNWKPGAQGGMPVRVKYTLPVKFSLKNN